MTFTEAAIEVLRREGKPLHFKKIAEIAVRDSLLDHVGKIPEDVMGGQLATHCKLPHADRKVVVVQPGTFALVEWGLDEDPTGLENLIEPPPEDELLYRARERHPAPSREMARSSGRGEGRPPRRRDEGEERRGRRYPPPAEVAFEILAGADHPLSLSEIAAQGAERLLMPDVFVRDAEALSAALLEDNKRRESAGRRPLFALDGGHVSLAAQPEPGERAATPLAPVRAAVPTDLRKSALIALRRRLEACDPPTVEHVMGKLLEQMGVRELKVAKRGRDHVVYTGRRKLGLAEVRHCFRILRGGADPGRRDISDARRDVGNYGAQIGIVLSTGEAGRETRSDATAAGQLPVLLLCGEALAEAFTEHGVGCQPVVVPEIDEVFFRAAADAAQQEEAARRTRREERDRREGREPREPREPREARELGEAREPLEGREPREPRAARGEREVPAEREIVVEREVSAEREPRQRAPREEAAAPTEPEAPIVLFEALEVSLERGAPAALEAEDGEEDGEEGDD
ncbi:MAG TPA: HTH domain-containing protein, partial [Anaeromyxobacteraceae bacterium]